MPRLMREGQRASRARGITYLVDADRPSAGWGKPDYGSTDPKEWGVTFLKMKTREALETVGKGINYLHIDADHSYAGVAADFDMYDPLMAWPNAAITLHDTMWDECGVPEFVAELRHSPRFQVLDIPVGNGVAIVRRVG